MKKQYTVTQGRKRRNDAEKTDWTRLGIAWADSKGMRVKLNALPLPDENGEVWFNVFPDDGEKRQGGGNSNYQASPQQQAQPVNGNMNDDIPF